MAKFGIQKGDKIFYRSAAARDENTGKVISIPNTKPKPALVTKVWHHGVRVQGWGYVHNNCIISKQE